MHARFAAVAVFVWASHSVLDAPTRLAADTIELASGDRATRPQQPQVAVDAQGAIHVVFGVGQSVFYRRSQDGGVTFAPPNELPALGVVSLGMRRGPRIAVAGDSVVISAIAGPRGLGRDGDVVCCRSNDGGATWQGPVRVNDVESAAREGLHGMSAGADGLLCCVWLDLRRGKTDVMSSTSTDGGATWSKNILVYQSPDGSVCECCHPSVAIGNDGRIHVLFRNSLGGNRDMYVAASGDGGATFGKAQKLGATSWELDACPMDGGAIACLPDGSITTVWREDETVFLQRGDAPAARLLGNGEQPWIATTKAGPYVTWLDDRPGKAMLLSPGDAKPRELAVMANDPVIAASASGDGPVVALWERRVGEDRFTIECEVLETR